MLDEKYPDETEIKGYGNFEFMINWLNSQGDMNCHAFAEVLQGYLTTGVKNSQMLTMEKSNKSPDDSVQNSLIEPSKMILERKYLNKLPYDIECFINEKP